MSVLSDFETQVVLNLGNRADLNTGVSPTRLQQWVRDAYIDLTMSVPFEELEFSINDVFVPSIGEYAYPADARAIVTLSFDPSVTDGVTQSIRRKNIKVIRRYPTTTIGPPAVYASFNRKIHVRPVPDQAYPFVWDYWQLPQLAAPVEGTQVLTPLDWDEIIMLMATLRGHIGLLERDKAAELRTLLYGDPTDQSNPGLIKKKLLIHAAENVDSDFAIRPKVRSYTSR